MEKNSYKQFSQIYDLLMDDIEYEKWTSFIIERIGDSSNILEAACGTGNITKHLAERGYHITAFDLSQDMLMRAYDKLGRNPGVRLLNQDMTSFKIDDKFEAAICCCDGVNYLSEAQVAAFFNRVYEHLKINGKFIFDISTRYKYDTVLNDTYVYDDGDIFYVWENTHDSEGSFVNIEVNFFISDINDVNNINDKSEKYERITEIQTQYIYSTDEIASMLRKAGFENIEIFDDYNNDLCNEASLRAVFTAVKALR